MKRIVSFSLWGTGAKYWVGASRNVALVRQHYPGWGCRFYVDSSCDPVLASGLSAALDPQMDGIEVVPSRGPYHGMFWRFTPAFDESVDAFVSRDCDSRISTREASAVAEWLGSGMEFHAMRDHPFHNMPIQGGMWGCRSGLLRRLGLEPAFSAWTDFSRWGCDQEFLSRHVYPAVRHVTLEHNGFPLARTSFGNAQRPFPSDREDWGFVGEVFDELDRRGNEYWIIKSYNGQFGRLETIR